jgi:hypothetical protein
LTVIPFPCFFQHFTLAAEARWGANAPLLTRTGNLSANVAEFCSAQLGTRIADASARIFLCNHDATELSGGARAFDGLASSERTAIRSALPDTYTYKKLWRLHLTHRVS